MSAGDVLLFSRKIDAANFKADPFGTFMCALIHLTTRSRFNHASLDIGDGLMVEATNRGVVVSPIESADEIRVIPIPADMTVPELADLDNFAACPDGALLYCGDDLEQVLAWSTARVGWRYGFGNAFWCGLRNLFPGVAHIKHGRSIICSELVSEALERAGHDWDKDTALVVRAT